MNDDIDLRKWAVEMALTNAAVMSLYRIEEIVSAAQRFHDFAMGVPSVERSPGAFTPSAFAAPARDDTNISEGHL